MKSNLYFKHDLYALDDSKLRRLILKHGAIGYATFFETVVKLTKEETHRCSIRDLASDISYAIHEDESKIIAALECAVSCGLLINDNGKLYSERVDRSCLEFSNYSHVQAEKARKRWENKSNTTASVGNAAAMQRHSNSNATAMPIKEIEKEIEIKINELPNGNSCPTLFENSGGADGNDPVFVTIPLISGEEYPIKESVVKMWEESYPAVDVKGQLREMKSWCFSNPKERKTARGIMRFCNNWLSREQDKPSYNRKGGNGYGNKVFRPRDINGQYDDIESEVIEV